VNLAAKEYNRRWYEKNKEKVLADKKLLYSLDGEFREGKKAYSKAYHASNRLACCAKARRRIKEIKDLVFEAYGGYICNCPSCPVSDPRFLTIDHINGCTKEQRKLEGLGSRFYRYLHTNGFPPGYQVLCFNCNLGRAKNQGICPHSERLENK
jgi:hypothetical protein